MKGCLSRYVVYRYSFFCYIFQLDFYHISYITVIITCFSGNSFYTSFIYSDLVSFRFCSTLQNSEKKLTDMTLVIQSKLSTSLKTFGAKGAYSTFENFKASLGRSRC